MGRRCPRTYVGSGSLFIHIYVTMVQQDLQVAKTIVEGAGRLVINVVWAWGEVQHMGWSSYMAVYGPLFRTLTTCHTLISDFRIFYYTVSCYVRVRWQTRASAPTAAASCCLNVGETPLGLLACLIQIRKKILTRKEPTKSYLRSCRAGSYFFRISTWLPRASYRRRRPGPESAIWECTLL